jgi:hypothetical protein
MSKIKTSRKRQWSVLAYIAGDNSLSDEGLSDVTEMCAEGSLPNMHVGVQIDTSGDFDDVVRYEMQLCYSPGPLWQRSKPFKRPFHLVPGIARGVLSKPRQIP